MTEETTTAVAETRRKEITVPPIRSLIVPPGNFADYMRRLIETASAAVEDARRKVLKAEHTEDTENIAEAKRALEAAQRLGGQEGHDQQRRWRWELNSRERRKKVRLARAKRRLTQATNMAAALQAGYVPLPRMPAVRMDYMYEVMPPDVLDAFTEAKEVGVFEEFRVITGQETLGNSGLPDPGRGRHPGRDPILVGLIGHELFAVGWWRP
jgi:hypothetical protein